MARIGGRIDWDGQEGRELTISAEAYSGTSGEHRITRTLLPPYLTIGDAEVDVRGGFIMGRWSRDLGADSDVEVKAYFDSHKRNGPPFVSDRDTVDLDFQHRFSLGNAHDIIWGVNLRRSDETTVGTLDVNFAGQERVHRLISAFVQDEISLFDGNARLMIGSKFERNNFSDDPLEIEPSVRFSVNLSESSTFWASASRAARMPSRGEQDGSVTAEVIPAGFGPMPLPVPTVVSIVGDRGMISEMVTAYEMGYRFRTEETLVDFAVFYNDFTDQRSIVPGAPNCQPGGELLMLNPLCVLTASYAQIPLNLRNTNDSQTAGAELSIAKSMNESWQLQASYTYFRLLDLTGDGTDLGIPEDSPDHQISIRSMMDISHNMELDFWLRWVDSLDGQQIDSYTALDVRFAWSPMRSLTLTAGARNLIAGDHVEFVSEVTDLPQVQIEPEGFVELRWNF